MSGTKYPPGLNLDNLAWSTTHKSLRATYFEELNTRDDKRVQIHLEQRPGPPAPNQSLWCDLKTLDQVVSRGVSHEKKLHFKPGYDPEKPDVTEQIGDCTVSSWARITPRGNKQLVVQIEKRETGERLRCELGRLRQVVEEGHEFKQVLEHPQRCYVVMSLVSVNEPGEGAWARVAKTFPQLADAEKSVLQAKREGFNADDLVVWPVPRWPAKPGEQIFVREGVGYGEAITKRIELMRWNQGREGEYFVMASWNDPKIQPKLGTLATWGGKQATYDGEPLEYRAVPQGRDPGGKLFKDNPMVLINKKDQTIVALDSDRNVIATKFRELEAKHQERARTLGPDWEKQSFDMKPNL